MDEKTVNFLHMNQLSCLVEKFKDEFIDYGTLVILNKDDIEKVVPQLGLQKKLLTGLKKLLSEEINEAPAPVTLEEDFSSATDEAKPLISELMLQEPVVASNSRAVKRAVPFGHKENESTPPLKKARELRPSDVKNNVRSYLDKSVKGLKFLGLYERGCFNGTVRSDLAEYIIDCEFDKDIGKVITPKRFLELRDEVVAVFPSEVVATYYIPRRPKSDLKGSNQPKGKLYDKYTSFVKELRTAGLRNRRFVDTPVEKENTDVPDPEGNEDLIWLRGCLKPMNEAIERWNRTSAVRIQSLRVTHSRRKKGQRNIDEVTEYLDEFKVLRQPWGYSLLQEDYKYLYGNSELALMENWSAIAIKIKRMSGLEPTFADTIGDTVRTLLLIPALFGPTHVGKWKTSAVDTQSGFLFHVNAMSSLVNEVNRLRNKLAVVKRTVQPFPIIVGSDLDNITDSYVYIDNFYYQVDSPLRAVDVCFKAYHALHALYPHQSLHPWLFLQRAVYGLVTPWDPQVPCVETKIKEYEVLD